MTLRARLKKIESERKAADAGSSGPSIIIRSFVAPGSRDESRPGFAYIIKGPLAGKKVTADPGETKDEFAARVNRMNSETAREVQK